MGATESGATDGAVKNIQSKSGLGGSVGIKGANAPGDVWKVSSALANNGLMEAPQSHADNTLFTGITTAQQNMGNSLKADGLINPGGPTESTYTKYVGQGFMKAPDSKEPDTGTGLKPLGTAKDVLERDHAKQEAADQQARLQRQAERRQERERAEAAKRATMTQTSLATAKPETVQKAAQGLGALANKAASALTGGATASPLPRGEGQGEGTLRQALQEHDAGNPLTRRSAPPSPGGRGIVERPTLSDAAYVENRRTADALGKYKGVGDLPRFTTDAINTNGEQALHEVADLIGQVHDRSPEQAFELFQRTHDGINDDMRPRLERAYTTLKMETLDEKPTARTMEKRGEDQGGIKLLSANESPDAGSPSDSPANLDIGAGLKEADGSETLSISIESVNSHANPIAGQTKRQRDRHGERPSPAPVPTDLKGTTFFGGAGMGGEYIPDMVKALEEAGFENVRAADPKVWSSGITADAVGTIFERSRDGDRSDFSKFGNKGEQFNLVGYSHGALQAAQAAADYADGGGSVDNLVLVGAPISQEFLDKLKANPNIKNVIVQDLTEQGDPIRAGMTAGEQILAVPSLGVDFSASQSEPSKGHFYYSGDDEEGAARRRQLAEWLKNQGLK